MGIKIRHKGDLSKTEKYLKNANAEKVREILERYAMEGVHALMMATPVNSGATAMSWSYEIEQSEAGVKIVWTNSNINKNVNIAIILQYGHGTRNGGYVAGIDYINPTMKPVFDKIADKVWKEVTQ